MTYMQEAPFSIQVEATEGCNLRCGFCGIRGIREKGQSADLSGPYKYMTADTVQSLAKQVLNLGWTPRWEFAMHGEPTMSPVLPDLVDIIRSYHPDASIMVTTNGIPMLEGRQRWHGKSIGRALVRLFRAGVNTIAIDDYAPHRVAPTVRDCGLRVPVLEYPSNQLANPHVRYKKQRVVIVEDIAQAVEGTHATLNNHAGSGGPPSDTMIDKVCTLPFRELSIRWDGEFAICCNDWRGQYNIGNVGDLEDVWHGERMHAARSLLYHEGRADIQPCAGCDYRGTRTGLLPDKKGKQTMPAPTPRDRAIAFVQQEQPTITPVVLQRWER